MQKIKKINLIVLIIVLLISAVTTIILFKTGIAKIKLYNSLNIIDLIMFILAALAWTFGLADIYKMKRDKRKLAQVKFNVSIEIKKLFTISVILLLFISICEIILFIIEGEAASLAFAMVLIPTSCTNLLHNKAKNAICENGIYHWGVYHPWNKIKSYEINDNVLKLMIEAKLLSKNYTNEIKFFFDINESDNISDFLNSQNK